jgi:hypothetical protein
MIALQKESKYFADITGIYNIAEDLQSTHESILQQILQSPK